MYSFVTTSVTPAQVNRNIFFTQEVVLALCSHLRIHGRYHRDLSIVPYNHKLTGCTLTGMCHYFFRLLVPSIIQNWNFSEDAAALASEMCLGFLTIKKNREKRRSLLYASDCSHYVPPSMEASISPKAAREKHMFYNNLDMNIEIWVFKNPVSTVLCSVVLLNAAL